MLSEKELEKRYKEYIKRYESDCNMETTSPPMDIMSYGEFLDAYNATKEDEGYG